MNNLIKDNIRTKKEQIKSLDLKKENLKDKIELQNNLIQNSLIRERKKLNQIMIR